MNSPWKYTDDKRNIAFRYLEDGGMESCLVEILPEGTEILPADPVPNPRIAEIKSLLLSLDTKRIRPLAEGDTEYLLNLNERIVILRAELKTLEVAP